MRLSIVAITAAAVFASGHVVVAQDGAPTISIAPVAPAAAPLTPGALIGKSIKDLSKGRLDAAVKDDVKALRRGPLLIHGNYCGIGGRTDKPPIDDLDAACMRHDACTQTGTLPSCACDDRLRIEATAIAQDPRTPPDIQAMATATATGMALLVCKPTPKG